MYIFCFNLVFVITKFLFMHTLIILSALLFNIVFSSMFVLVTFLYKTSITIIFLSCLFLQKIGVFILLSHFCRAQLLLHMFLVCKLYFHANNLSLLIFFSTIFDLFGAIIIILNQLLCAVFFI